MPRVIVHLDADHAPEFHCEHPESKGKVSMRLTELGTDVIGYVTGTPADLVAWFEAGLTAARSILERSTELKIQALAPQVAEVITRYRSHVAENQTEAEVANDDHGEVEFEALDLAFEMWGRDLDDEEDTAIRRAVAAMKESYREAMVGTVGYEAP